MRIVTWNTQGNLMANGKLHSILSFNPDVICLQECGDIVSVLGGGFERKRSSLYYKLCSLRSAFRQENYHVYYYSWRNASRCSMATLVKEGYNVEKVCLKYYDYSDYYADRRWLPNEIYDFFSEEGYDAPLYDSTGRRGLRAMLQTIIDFGGNGQDYISINNVHLPSGRPRYAMRVAKSFFRKCRHRNSSVIIIGDMNIPAYMWEGQTIPYRQYSTHGATHQKGGNLDYLFTDLDCPSMIQSSRYYYQSDHLAVNYVFD